MGNYIYTKTEPAVSNVPRLKFGGFTGLHTSETWGRVGEVMVIPTGTRLAFDFGRAWHGELRYKPYDETRMRLLDRELPPFSGELDYEGAFRVSVLVQGSRVHTFTTTSEGGQRALTHMHHDFLVAPEAFAGKIPVYAIEESRTWESRFGSKICYSPVYALMGWVDRKPETFGTRLIPPPKQLALPEIEFAPPPPADDALFVSFDKAPAESTGKQRAEELLRRRNRDDINDETPF